MLDVVYDIFVISQPFIGGFGIVTIDAGITVIIGHAVKEVLANLFGFFVRATAS